MKRTPVAVALLCACQTRLCRDPDVWTAPEYAAPRASTPPVVDGALDDAAWKRAPPTDPLRRSNTGAAASHRTQARMAWDDANLYVAFDVEDDDILTPYGKDDDPLYESEVVEIFVDANDDGGSYDEIELSPADRLFDASFTGRRQGMNLAWRSGTRHAVRLDGTIGRSSDWDRGWTAELAIPIASLSAVPRVPPQVGDRWRVNLYRLDQGRGGVEGQAFSPVMVGDFHHLPRFGWLRFAP